MVNLGFGSLRTTIGIFFKFGLLDCTYAQQTVLTLLSLVEDVHRETTIHMPVNSTRKYTTFWKTPS
jgi:hypothetical protein